MKNKVSLLSICLIGLLLLQVISGFFPENIFWGIDYYRYIPYGFFFIVCFITFYILFIWLSGKWLKGVLDEIKNFVLSRPKILISLLSASVGAVIFYAFRVKLYFLGDGYLRIREIATGVDHAVTEPLDIFIHSVLYNWLSSKISLSAAQTYVLVSIACGVIFLFLLTFFIKYLGETAQQQWTTFFALLTSGTMLLFFGYAESYTIVTVLLMGFFIEGLRSIKKNTCPFIPSFLLGLSISTHTSVVTLIPALIYLWIRHLRSRFAVGKRILSGLTGVCLFIFPMLATLIVFNIRRIPLSDFTSKLLKGNNFLPFSAADRAVDTAYSLVSVSHLLDIINELFLISPVFFIGLIIIFIYRKRLFFSRDPQWLFLAIASVVYFISFTGFNLRIGASRDWDLFSPMAIPLTLFTMHSIFLVKPRLNRRELGVLGMFLLLHIIPWILVNSNKEWSLNRFNAMTSDSKWSQYAKAYAFDELRFYYVNNDKIDISITYARKAVLNHSSPRNLFNLAIAAHRLNRLDEAAANYRKVLEIDQNDYEAYINYGKVLFNKGQFEESLTVLNEAKKRSESSKLYYNTGLVLDILNRPDEAALNYKNAIEVDPNNYDAYIHYGRIFFEKKRYIDALAVCEAGLQRFETPDLYFNKAAALVMLNHYSDAIPNIKKALELNPNHSKALNLLNQLNRIKK